MRIVSISNTQAGIVMRAYDVKRSSSGKRRRGSSPKSVLIDNPARTIGNRYNGGTYPRQCHCSKVLSATPSALAMGSINFQFGDAMSDRIHDKLSPCQRQLVESKNASQALRLIMDDGIDERSAYERAVQKRLKALRALIIWEQSDVAVLCGMSTKAAQQMETRLGSKVPSWVSNRLYKATGVDISRIDEPLPAKLAPILPPVKPAKPKRKSIVKAKRVRNAL